MFKAKRDDNKVLQRIDTLSSDFNKLVEKIEESPAIKMLIEHDKYKAICEIVNSWNENRVTASLAMIRIRETIENKLQIE